MKKEMYVSIPQPCHENWNMMTPQDKGRFCESCAKTVVDFSQMSDAQVLNYLSQSTGRLCGRFAQDQVERPLIPFKKEKKKIWWMAALMPMTLLLSKANGQKIGKRPIETEYNKCTSSVGLIAVETHADNATTLSKHKTITGTVMDEEGLPIYNATVILKETKTATITDTAGKFVLSVDADKSSGIIHISYLGYESRDLSYVFTNTDIINLDTKLQALTPAMLGDVVVVGGYAISYHKVKKIDTLKTIVRKIIRTNPFKVYPNPINRGASVNIDVKMEGHYTIQLLDMNSKLIANEYFNAVKGAALTSLNIPASTTTGIYFIRLINDDTKQQYTDKIVIR